MTTSSGPARAPLAIGGMGGSGTRVVAQACMALGIDLGPDRNQAEDNAWFTLLFKRPSWFGRATLPAGEVDAAVAAFTAASVGPRSTLDAHRGTVLAAAAEAARHGQERQGVRRPAWAAQRLVRLQRDGGRPPAPTSRGWGWKEPNTNLFLAPLARRHPTMRYVHVVRHGLDMAYSSNQQQFRNWAALVGVPAPGPEVRPAAALDFWIAANDRALADAQRLGIDHHVCNFDALVDDPAAELDRLLDWLGLDPVGAVRERLAALVRRPASVGRHRRRDGQPFTPAQRDAVARYGFEA